MTDEGYTTKPFTESPRLTYKDMNELAHDAASAITDALDWLGELNEPDGDAVEEALESAEHFVQRAACALDEYAHETEDVPQGEWGDIDHANHREHGIWPHRRVLLAPQFAPQADFARKLYQLQRELQEVPRDNPATTLPTPLPSFGCTVAELAARLKTAFEAIAPVHVPYDGPDEGPGFGYHPKC